MILEIWLLIAGIASCILLDALFSGAESGMMLSDPIKLQHQADRGDKRSRQILKLKQNPEVLFGVILIGSNAVIVSATMLGNRLLEYWFEPVAASVITVAGLTFIILIVGEIVPKAVFISRPEDLTRRIVPAVRVLIFIFRPILFIFSWLTNMIVFLLGGAKKVKTALTREDISLLAETSARDGVINQRSYAFFGSVLAFGSTTAREIMTPLVDVTAIEENAGVEELVRVIMRSGFSRIPVYHEQVFTMIGYVSAFDLRKSRRNENISEYIRRADFVPESKNINGLLIDMRQKRLPLVFVVDEWGGTAGIITHEDIAEHVVGQIRDKGEKLELEMRQDSPGEYLADGWTDIDKAQQVLHIRIEKKGFETVGGFLEHIMQRIPAAGESIVYEGYQFCVEEADERRIIRVRIRQKKLAKAKKKKQKQPNGKKNGAANDG
jgi:CBS domain containing-hemolysin-like protein